MGTAEELVEAMDTQGKFYIGRIFDLKAGQARGLPLLYDPADLTTHAVVVGMTGSGKTGLCLSILEEAALLGIPALMIDPKGDITNSLLHFPDLAPQDFLPWINPDQARREKKTTEQAAHEAAEKWRKGLEDWEIPQERMKALQNSVQFAIYTPGSDAGIPISILASLKAPLIPWNENREILREKIAGTVTALLSLVGVDDLDPVRSREHILLSNIFENAWSKGMDLDLGELILQTQTPPFTKLGVFDVNIFFPEKDRFDLAMLLNNILAAPAFQSWIEGQPLDIPNLLFTPEGRPRHSVFYIAHLSDSERMFFVALLFSAIETWMRTQGGSSSLRALVYFDEIFGYLPPLSNPPSKQTILRMLKQARAFGVGQVLVTQNPVDLDYKALSNAGTWFIGKLQTDQDKVRLLDGLESASTAGVDRSEYDRLISSLSSRVFLLHNVHEKNPVIFQSRWAMNYLAGPLTRIQIPLLNRLAGARLVQAAEAPKSAAAQFPAGDAAQEFLASQERNAPPKNPSAATAIPLMPASPVWDILAGSTTRPTVPAGVKEYILPNNLTLSQAFKAAEKLYSPDTISQALVYDPVILGQASIRFLNRTYNIDYEMLRAVLVPAPDRRGMVHWEDHEITPLDTRSLETTPPSEAHFSALEAPFTEARLFAAMQKDFLDWIYRTSQVLVRAQEELKLYSGPQVSLAEFHRLVAETRQRGLEEELTKLNESFNRRIGSLQARLSREERELTEDQTEFSQRKMEETGTHVENLLNLFNKRAYRKLSTSLVKRRLTEQAKADVEESHDAIEDFQRQISALQEQKEAAAAEINARWDGIASNLGEITLAPFRKDILVDLFGVAWMPYYRVSIGQEVIKLPGYGTGRQTQPKKNS
jgi:hypothetical protein